MLIVCSSVFLENWVVGLDDIRVLVLEHLYIHLLPTTTHEC
jgi:hypothetical protein